MADIKTKAERSENMSRIRGKNTRPEIMVRTYLTKHGIRYRCNVKSLPGKPDIAIKKYKLAIKVNGCFWHGHEGCKDFRIPKSNVEFWTNKLRGNIDRDRSSHSALEQLGYTIFTIWECDIKSGNLSEIDKAIGFISRFKLSSTQAAEKQ